MRSFTFHPGPRLIAGAGEAASLADRIPDGPCLFVTDQQIIRLGLADECRAALEAGAGRRCCSMRSKPTRRRATLRRGLRQGRRRGAIRHRFRRRQPDGCGQARGHLIGSGDDLDSIWGRGSAAGGAAAAGRWCRPPPGLAPKPRRISVITATGAGSSWRGARPLIADCGSSTRR